MPGGGKKVTVGFRYFLGLHLGVCQGPVDEVSEIRVGGRTAWKGNLEQTQQLTINKNGLFGGKSREGGISGDVDVEFGEATQAKNDYLLDQFDDVPAHRGILGLVLRQVYLGTIPRFKAWAVTASRQPENWPGALSDPDIGDDANPAHIIYECITSARWGMGHDDARVDTDSFDSAAGILSSEGFGLSFLWSQDDQSIDDFINDVLRYIDASLYLDPDDGRFRLKLHRDDYSVSNLEELGRDDVVELRDFSRPSWGDLTNEVTIIHTDGEGDTPSWKEASITQQNIAVFRAQGNRVVPKTVRFPAIMKESLANRVLARELHQLSQPLARVDLTLTAVHRSIRPGDVRIWSDPEQGVEQLVIRVVEVDYGTLQDGRVRVQAVEDAFAARDAVFADPKPTEWVDPASEPESAQHRRLTEATYFQVALEAGDNQTIIGDLPDTAAFLTTQAVKPTADSFGYEVHVNAGGGFEQSGDNGDFTPTAVLSAATKQEESSTIIVDLQSAKNLSVVESDTFALLGDQIVAVRSINTATGELDIDQGVIDTVPQPHSIGERIYFAQDFESMSRTEYSDGESIDVKMLTRTSLGEIDLASAPTDAITFDARFIRPYPPGRVRLAGEAYPNLLFAPLTVTWAHRDRTQQTGPLIAQDAGDIGPEPGTTYTLRVIDRSNGQQLVEKTGITGTTYDDSDGADTLTPNSAPVEIRIELLSQRDGYDSWQTHQVDTDRRGYAFVFDDSDGNLTYGGFAANA